LGSSLSRQSACQCLRIWGTGTKAQWRGEKLIRGEGRVGCREWQFNLLWSHALLDTRVFYGASIYPFFGVARPRTRRLLVLHTRAIVQPSGPMCPFRLRAPNSPCIGIRRRGAETLPIKSRRTSQNEAGQSKDQVRGSLAVPGLNYNETWCDAATRRPIAGDQVWKWPFGTGTQANKAENRGSDEIS
jgi:hypothetical protein